MKKYFLIAVGTLCLVQAAQAQTSTQQTRRASTTSATTARTSNGMVNNDADFHQKVATMRASLNANDFSAAQNQWVNIEHLMARRGDEVRKINGDAAGAQRRYTLASKMKDMSQNMSGNKTALLQLLNDMDAAY